MADIFRSFCSFIKQEFFSTDAVGEEVSFAVDKYTIQKFCIGNNSSEVELINSARKDFWKYSHTQEQILGILAIQLYAASLRKEEYLYSSRNYTIRLRELLNWDDNDWKKWMYARQDEYWETFYNWCTEQGFYIQRCKPFDGPGRFVQYPIEHSKTVFTEEDLLYISNCFVENHLFPGEDISYCEFNRIIGHYDIERTIKNPEVKHALRVLDYSLCKDDYLRQVYNFYLRWDGKSKERLTQKTISAPNESVASQLYMTEDLKTLEFRTKDMVLQEPKLCIDNLSYNTIKSRYSFRRKNKSVIIFKRDDIYDNYWQETRFLEPGSVGRAIVFRQQSSRYFPQKTILKSTNSITIIEISKENDPFDCYSEEKPFSIIGGLKIGRDKYLLGAGPTIRVSKNIPFWINGERHEGIGDYQIIQHGRNIVKFRDYKSIEINIVAHTDQRHIWRDNYTKWILNRGKALWEPSKKEGKVVGLDFSDLIPAEDTNKGVLTRWARYHLLRERKSKEHNIAIKQLINNLYE